MLWANKHRPTKFDELVGGASELAYITSNPQHLLLHSRGAGTGKTSLAHVLANELGYTLHVFNASSKKTRGISFVEEELIPLTSAGISQQFILLDEADQLTPEAQGALKGVIENSQGYFILTCNDISKVTPWLQSRCLNIEFKPISKRFMMDRLVAICGTEGVSITESQLGLICDYHEGDLRNAINALQAFHSLEPIEAHQFLLSLRGNDFDVDSFLKVTMQDKDILASIKMLDGDVRILVRNIFRRSLDALILSPKIKLQVVDAAITAERDILNGVDEDIVKANFVRILIE